MVRIFAMLLLVACSSSKDKSEPAPAAPAAPVVAPVAPKDDSPRGLCARGCAKLISCAPLENKEELPRCIDTCAAGTPQKAQIEQIESMSCEQIATGGVPAAQGRGSGSAM